MRVARIDLRSLLITAALNALSQLAPPDLTRKLQGAGLPGLTHKNIREQVEIAIASLAFRLALNVQSSVSFMVALKDLRTHMGKVNATNGCGAIFNMIKTTLQDNTSLKKPLSRKPVVSRHMFEAMTSDEWKQLYASAAATNLKAALTSDEKSIIMDPSQIDFERISISAENLHATLRNISFLTLGEDFRTKLAEGGKFRGCAVFTLGPDKENCAWTYTMTDPQKRDSAGYSTGTYTFSIRASTSAAVKRTDFFSSSTQKKVKRRRSVSRAKAAPLRLSRAQLYSHLARALTHREHRSSTL